MSTGPITRAAFGRTAQLGDLYDARRDALCGVSIFSQAIPPAAISRFDSHSHEIQLVDSVDVLEKLSKLDTCEEEQMSVLSGMLTPDCYGGHLSTERQFERMLEKSLIYKLKSQEKSVNIFHKNLKEVYSLDAIKTGLATYVIVGISQGAHIIITYFCEGSYDVDVVHIQKQLTQQMENLRSAIRDGTDFTWECDKKLGINYNIRSTGYILQSGDGADNTTTKTIDVIRNLPMLVEAGKFGTGAPLTFKLFPIDQLGKYLALPIPPSWMLLQTMDHCRHEIKHVLQEMAVSNKLLHDFCRNITPQRRCILDEDVVKIFSLLHKTIKEDIALRQNIKNYLIYVRSCSTVTLPPNVDSFTKFLHGRLHHQQMRTALGKFNHVLEKIQFVRLLVKNGAKYTGRDSSPEQEILDNIDREIWLLHFSYKRKLKNNSTWTANVQRYFQVMKQDGGGKKYFAVDCDVHSDLLTDDHNIDIKVLEAGHAVTDDLVPYSVLNSNNCNIV